MKKNLVTDISFYVIAPIGICYLTRIENMKHMVIFLMIILVFYTIKIYKNKSRLNICGLSFAILYTILYLIKIKINSDFIRYIYDTYFFISLLIVINILKILNKNVITQLYMDFMMIKCFKKHYIKSIAKKNNISKELEKIFNIVNIHILFIIFIRIYSISKYGYLNYTVTNNLEKLVFILFLISETYMIYSIIKKSYNKNNKEMTWDKKSRKQRLNNIIYLDKYKKYNR